MLNPDRKNNYPRFEDLPLSEIAKGSIYYCWLELVSNPLGNPVGVPVMIAKGVEEGPTLGLTAAIHGNELNGIPVIHKLFRELDVQQLKGTIIAVPVVNIPSFLRKRRRFSDQTDLNHIMPGKANGRVSEVYAFRFFEKAVRHFDCLLDLHTASEGRINSYYIRADMEDKATRELALLQNPEIIVHNPPHDGTLRGAADEIGIPAITLEVGNPSIFQKKLIHSGVVGVHNALIQLKMLEGELISNEKKTVLCKKSYWLYTDLGGLLTVHAGLCERVKKGDLLATQRTIFGEKIREYFAPEDGIVIGKSTNPVSNTGGRILHLGIM